MDNIKAGCQPDQNTTQSNKAKGRPSFYGRGLESAATAPASATTSAKAATLTAKIGSTATTGGAVALTTSNCGTLGAVVAGSAITAANTGTSSDTISIAATSVTRFSEGRGVIFIRVQNMDTADAFASTTALLNAVRSGLVTLGLIKGS